MAFTKSDSLTFEDKKIIKDFIIDLYDWEGDMEIEEIKDFSTSDPNYNVLIYDNIEGTWNDTFSIIYDRNNHMVMLSQFVGLDDSRYRNSSNYRDPSKDILILQEYIHQDMNNFNSKLEDLRDEGRLKGNVYVIEEEHFSFKKKNHDNYTGFESYLLGCFTNLKEATTFYEKLEKNFDYHLDEGKYWEDDIYGHNLFLNLYPENGDVETINGSYCNAEYEKMQEINLIHYKEVERIADEIEEMGPFDAEKIIEIFGDFKEFGKDEVVVKKSENVGYDYIAYINDVNGTEFLIDVDEKNTITYVNTKEINNYYLDMKYLSLESEEQNNIETEEELEM